METVFLVSFNPGLSLFMTQHFFLIVFITLLNDLTYYLSAVDPFTLAAKIFSNEAKTFSRLLLSEKNRNYVYTYFYFCALLSFSLKYTILYKFL
jgi:hypothetical protein